MGMKEKIMEKQITNATGQLLKVIESLHAHIEIMSREIIRTRLEMKKSNVTNDDIEEIINDYQRILN